MINSFEDYSSTKKEILEYKKSAMKIIDDFVNLYLKHIKKYKECTDFFETRDNKFIVSYINTYNDSNTITFDIGDETYEKLINFLDNPQLYKNQKKFNI